MGIRRKRVKKIICPYIDFKPWFGPFIFAHIEFDLPNYSDIIIEKVRWGGLIYDATNQVPYPISDANTYVTLGNVVNDLAGVTETVWDDQSLYDISDVAVLQTDPVLGVRLKGLNVNIKARNFIFPPGASILYSFSVYLEYSHLI